MRAIKLRASAALPQDSDVLRHWTERQREILLAEQLDRLTRVLERLAAVLERRPCA